MNLRLGKGLAPLQKEILAVLPSVRRSAKTVHPQHYQWARPCDIIGKLGRDNTAATRVSVAEALFLLWARPWRRGVNWHDKATVYNLHSSTPPLHADNPYQDMIALFKMPDAKIVVTGRSGLHHMQLRKATMLVLQERYRLLRAAGVTPFQAMDHGPSTSQYYRDPDQNAVEISASNYATNEVVDTCLVSENYSAIRQVRSSIPRNGLDSRGSRPTHLEALRHSAWSDGVHPQA